MHEGLRTLIELYGSPLMLYALDEKLTLTCAFPVMDKKRLIEHCRSQLRTRLDDLLHQQQELESGLTGETKSTAGDKHETGRAMLHLEIDQLKRQSAEAAFTLDRFNALFENNGSNPVHSEENRSEAIRAGSLVLTNNGYFLLSVAGGRMFFENQTCYLISSDSPLGKKLTGSNVNDVFELNGMSYSIDQIG